MRFFVLVNAGETLSGCVTEFLPVANAPVGNAERCAACGRWITMLPLLPPSKVDLTAWGPQYGDLALGSASVLLVSPRTYEHFLSDGLTGMENLGPAKIVRVKAHNRDMGAPPRYIAVRVAHSNAAIDVAASGLITDGEGICPKCRLGGIITRISRLVLESDTWSGEDIFVARGLPSTFIASERFADLCRRHELTNCHLIPADNYELRG